MCQTFCSADPGISTMTTRLVNIVSSYIILRDGWWNETTKHQTLVSDLK